MPLWARPSATNTDRPIIQAAYSTLQGVGPKTALWKSPAGKMGRYAGARSSRALHDVLVITLVLAVQQPYPECGW